MILYSLSIRIKEIAVSDFYEKYLTIRCTYLGGLDDLFHWGPFFITLTNILVESCKDQDEFLVGDQFLNNYF